MPGIFRRGADGVWVTRLMRGDGPTADAQHRPGPRSRAAAADAHSSRDARDTALTAASLAVLAASAVMALVARDADVGEAKVRQLDVPVGRDEEVIGLDVSVDDAPLVAVVERQDDLSRVLPRVILAQPPEVLKQRV